ncbi:unnamed protein product [Urochloa humidicola]
MLPYFQATLLPVCRGTQLDYTQNNELKVRPQATSTTERWLVLANKCVLLTLPIETQVQIEVQTKKIIVHGRKN